MVNAIVLMNVEPKMINEVAQKLVDIDGVSEVYSVGGRFDLVAMVRVPDNEALARVVTEHFLQVDGIKASETLIAYRSVSKFDMERLFSVGA
ncbi:MAG: Lrp/AsnC ligand binding domain-containing protein [Desulfovibrionaceae bacterium]|nr:Lrp/AsnC ligand binding domain-containing protein [Desulfovibrionaceae bacterium]MDD4952397.1 Lrp/AsnC ligand binding domain-containing protein [Desulfovibrionaceae bacterium]